MTETGLQFDHAEHPAPASGAVCGFCKQSIATTYFEINGQVACSRCRSQVMAAWNRGSPAKRFAKAFGLGAAAAALGAAVYYAFVSISNIDWSLVTVAIGVFVGSAVRKGSNGRGGWRYQLLAMFLTYSAVVATDSSLIAREFTKEFRARADSVRATAGPSAALAGVGAATTASDSTLKTKRDRPGALVAVIGLVVLLGLAYAAPIAIGVASPLHLLIAGLGLYAAWKVNRGGALRVTGPYQAVAPSAA
ncbi:MAG TPA: hypothetical protein VJN39_00460 [Gemmatimonadales bacterium]|nr:hypothetical protein [Gemmatimonadales bacterium]